MTTLSNTVHALESAWTAIRTIHPDTRPALITVFLSGNGTRGYFWRDSWTTRTGQQDEIHISSEILSEGPESVLRTLLHEACHSVASQRGIQDVSRQGRYHNKEFFKLASSMGLIVEPVPEIGAATTGLQEETKKVFANVLEELDAAIDAYQQGKNITPRIGKKGKTRMVKLVCPVCKRIIRASRATIDAGAILCCPCQEEFVENAEPAN